MLIKFILITQAIYILFLIVVTFFLYFFNLKILIYKAKAK